MSPLPGLKVKRVPFGLEVLKERERQDGAERKSLRELNVPLEVVGTRVTDLLLEAEVRDGGGRLGEVDLRVRELGKFAEVESEDPVTIARHEGTLENREETGPGKKRSGNIKNIPDAQK